MARSLIWLLPLALLGAGLAHAQTSLDDPLDDHSAKRLDRMEKVIRELRTIVFQARDTGHPVIVEPADTDSRLAGLADRLNDAQQAISKLNGELEVVRHDLDQTRQQESDLKAANAVLEAKVGALEAAPAPRPSAAAEPPPLPEPAPQPTPSSQLSGAIAAVGAGDMSSAEPMLKDYVDRFGDGPRGQEARYYLAKTLMARGAWAEAATAEIGAVRGWPKTRWAPDAVVDLARQLVALKKPEDACQALGELTRRYPKPTLVVARAADDVRARAKCG